MKWKWTIVLKFLSQCLGQAYLKHLKHSPISASLKISQWKKGKLTVKSDIATQAKHIKKFSSLFITVMSTDTYFILFCHVSHEEWHYEWPLNLK